MLRALPCGLLRTSRYNSEGCSVAPFLMPQFALTLSAFKDYVLIVAVHCSAAQCSTVSTLHAHTVLSLHPDSQQLDQRRCCPYSFLFCSSGSCPWRGSYSATALCCQPRVSRENSLYVGLYIAVGVLVYLPVSRTTALRDITWFRYVFENGFLLFGLPDAAFLEGVYSL
jgi:hypothetical protein